MNAVPRFLKASVIGFSRRSFHGAHGTVKGSSTPSPSPASFNLLNVPQTSCSSADALKCQPEIGSPEWRGTQSLLSLYLSSPCPLPSQQYPFIMPTMIPIINPLQPRIGDQRLPSLWNIEKLDPLPESAFPVEAPTSDQFKIRKSAARLIRIRRSKMKKHQYRKLKKRYGHVWEYYRKRRQLKRLKIFYAEQELIIKNAKEFDAEAYVRNFIQTAKACQEELQAKAVKTDFKTRPWHPRSRR